MYWSCSGPKNVSGFPCHQKEYTPDRIDRVSTAVSSIPTSCWASVSFAVASIPSVLATSSTAVSCAAS